MNDLRNEIYAQLTKDYKEWTFDEHCAKHKSGVTFWLANGLPFFSVYESGASPTLGFINWVKFWYWLKWARNKQFYEKLQTA